MVSKGQVISFLLLLSMVLISVPVYADIISDLDKIEEELGVHYSDKKTIERISAIEEELGIVPDEDVPISQRVNNLRYELGIAEESKLETADKNSEENSALIDAALKFIYEDDEHYEEAKFINESALKLMPLSGEELSELLNGDFFEIVYAHATMHSHPIWALERFSSGTSIIYAWLDGEYYDTQEKWIRYYDEKTSATLNRMEIHENYYTCIDDEDESMNYQIYKLKDNLYIKSSQKDGVTYEPFMIMVNCGSVINEIPDMDAFISDVIAKAAD